MAELVCAARDGHQPAWSELVGRLGETLRRIASSFRLAPADVDDVVQATWLELVEHIGTIREPAAILGWLATTVRHKSLRARGVLAREQPTDLPALTERGNADRSPEPDGPDARLLANERRAVLIGALATLPVRQRRLVTLLLVEPPLDYDQIGRTLSMPTGSIGPTRARSLARLADCPHLHTLR